jgi:hypothetical protein
MRRSAAAKVASTSSMLAQPGVSTRPRSGRQSRNGKTRLPVRIERRGGDGGHCLGMAAREAEALTRERVDGGGGGAAAIGADVVGAQGVDHYDGAGRLEKLTPGEGHTAIMP